MAVGTRTRQAVDDPQRKVKEQLLPGARLPHAQPANPRAHRATHQIFLCTQLVRLLEVSSGHKSSGHNRRCAWTQTPSWQARLCPHVNCENTPH